MESVLSSKVVITDHARQRIYERFGQINNRELTDLVRNARLNGTNSKNMPQEYYEYGVYRSIFKNERNGRKVRFFKGMYFVFGSGRNAASKILITVILYEPNWREKREGKERERLEQKQLEQQNQQSEETIENGR